MKYLFAVLLLTGCAIGQSPKKVIWVDYQGSDAVGTKLVFEFKEEVRKSSGYQLEMEKKVDLGGDYSIWMDFLSVDTADSGLSSAVSVVATTGARNFQRTCEHNVRMIHEVLVVGKDRTQEKAHQLLADLDKALHDAALCNGTETASAK